MAIAPIDLQTIFSQVDKVGRNQAAIKEGQALHQAMQGAHIQKKTEEEIKQVNQAQNTGDGAEKIKDRPEGQLRQGSGSKKEKDEEEKEGEEKKLGVFRDPLMGNKIDISL